MRKSIEQFVKRNTAFAWIALATGLLLLAPLLAMQFTAALNWSTMDFAVMGALLFGTGSLFVLVARRASRRHWLAIGVLLILGFVYLWAELAVGIFTNLGS